MNKDKAIGWIMMLVALTALSSLLLITIFIFIEGIPIINKSGISNFLLSTDWNPGKGHFGIASMVIGSFAVTIGAVIIGIILGLGCAIVLTQFCPRHIAMILKPVIELLAGIPSVVFGFMGAIILVPAIREYLGGPGMSVLASSIVLGIMILPTITSISMDAIQAVPRSYIEGSIALGATEWQTTHMVILKAAKSGIVAAFILGMGRAIGETMAVIMVAGNTLAIPGSPLEPVRTLTSHIAIEMGYAAGDHRAALFATGVTLFVIIMILNTIALTLSGRKFRRAMK